MVRIVALQMFEEGGGLTLGFQGWFRYENEPICGRFTGKRGPRGTSGAIDRPQITNFAFQPPCQLRVLPPIFRCSLSSPSTHFASSPSHAPLKEPSLATWIAVVTSLSMPVHRGSHREATANDDFPISDLSSNDQS